MPGADVREGWGMTVHFGGNEVSLDTYSSRGHSSNNWNWKVITTNASSDYFLIKNNE